jgi:hypothetical protein
LVPINKRGKNTHNSVSCIGNKSCKQTSLFENEDKNPEEIIRGMTNTDVNDKITFSSLKR